MVFINACSSITHQPTFQNKDWSCNLNRLDANSELINPNFKEFVNPVDLRRMSNIIRMGIACAKDCILQSNIENPNAIIVGTGLGCLTDTEKFLKNTITVEGLIPPTAFIQSTHNTIAGQLSLALKNHNYNMTHTQNSLSFEHALQDTLLCLAEDKETVLLGAADENIPLMEELAIELNLKNIASKLTTGASFFMISKNKNKSSKAKIIDSLTIGLNKNEPNKIVASFLDQNKLTLNDVDLILLNTNGTVNTVEIISEFSHVPVVDFEKYCGFYFTNVAFGMHLAVEILEKRLTAFTDSKSDIKRILLYNNFNNKNIGLTLLTSLEA